MSAVWFTSDLHIGHESVATSRSCYGSTDLHDRILAEKWDAVVRPEDQVWVLGDVTLTGAETVAYGLNWISDRPGTKHLIAGNHDPCHPMHRDAHKWQPAYLQVFASVQAFARRKIAGKNVLLSHFPYTGDHTETDRHTEYRLRDRNLPPLHGHTHSPNRLSRGRPRGLGIPGVIPWDGPLQIHVGVDAWNMTPVNLTEIEHLIAGDTNE